MTFLEIAKPLAEMGIPITPVRPGSKRAFLPDFPTTATTNLVQLEEWNKLYSDHNAACVARAEEGGIWFWELDSEEVAARILVDTKHNIYSDPDLKTFKVRSRPKRGHIYFRHNEDSIALGNISQTYVIGQDWSVRTNREYVVAPGSIHPDTGKPYEALNWGTPIATAPKWLIDWLKSQKITKTNAAPAASNGTNTGNGDAPRNEAGRVPHGSIHGYMLTQAGKLRRMGLDAEGIEGPLLALVHANCEPPIDEAKVRQMAKSICNFAPGEPPNNYLKYDQPQAQAAPTTDAPPPTLHTASYPVFPSWVMNGTSIYDGYVKPYCEINSRIPYFMWMPTATLMLNYLGTKVSAGMRDWKPSFYLVFIGERAKAHKSSSIKGGMKYLELAQVLDMYNKECKNAEGRTIVWEAGSPEGLGSDMQRVNCKNAVLFYDELSALAAKAGIEGSGMMGALLKMYESANFANSVKSKKDAFQVAPDSYVTTLITATTDQRFLELWAQFGGDDTGFDDRFTFVLQPEQLPEEKLPQVIPYQDAAMATRKLIDKAVNQKKFEFDYGFLGNELLVECMKVCGTRQEIRAEKWALYFAIDMGKTVIDEDCIARGVALVEYEVAVKKFLATEVAETKAAGLQQTMVQLLERNKGVVPEFGKHGFRALTGERKFGTDMWDKAFIGLVKRGILAQKDGGIHLMKDWGK